MIDSKQELTGGQLRLLRALEKWMENFFCNTNERQDNVIFALDNGFSVHAIQCMAGTGATDKRFDRIYAAFCKSVGFETVRRIEKREISELLKWCRVDICQSCNSHSFRDPLDDFLDTCPQCGSKEMFEK